MAGWAIAYALVLQAFFATAAAAQAMAAHPAAVNGTVFCLPSGGAAPELDPASPSKTQPDDCCLTCLLAGTPGLALADVPWTAPDHAMAEAPAPAAYVFVVVAFARVRSGETRGPPAA
jgi:hypothetical protein